jgi:hypothetical protein
VILAVLLATALAARGAALAYRAGQAQRWASHGAAALALLLLLDALVSPVTPAPPAFVLLAMVALLALALISAARLDHGGWAFAAALVGAFLQTAYALGPVSTSAEGSVPPLLLAGQVLAVLLFAAWPLLAAPRFQKDAWAWRAAALAGPLWFPGLHEVCGWPASRPAAKASRPARNACSAAAKACRTARKACRTAVKACSTAWHGPRQTWHRHPRDRCAVRRLRIPIRGPTSPDPPSVSLVFVGVRSLHDPKSAVLIAKSSPRTRRRAFGPGPRSRAATGSRYRHRGDGNVTVTPLTSVCTPRLAPLPPIAPANPK